MEPRQLHNMYAFTKWSMYRRCVMACWPCCWRFNISNYFWIKWVVLVVVNWMLLNAESPSVGNSFTCMYWFGNSSRNKAGFGNVFSSFLYILSSVLILEAGFFVFTNFLHTSQTCTVLWPNWLRSVLRKHGQLVTSFHHQHKVLTWLWLQNPHGMSDDLWIFANKVLVPSRFLSSFQMKLRWRWRLSRHITQGWWLKMCRGLYWWCSRILLPLLGSSSVRCQASIILKCFGCSSLCTFFVCRMVYDSDWQDYHFWELALAELLLEIHILMLHTTFCGELSYDS